MNRKALERLKCGSKRREKRSTPAIAQIIFGEKTTFIAFSKRSNLCTIIKKSLIGLASSLQSSCMPVCEQEIDLVDYPEFLFYVEDYAGRKIFLNTRENELSNLLRFFSYKLTIHVYLSGSLGDASIETLRN
ncbi:hypothetical protein NEMIN01_2014 [Nematocida minor]|uniref:uncharacterized protein n=1 Tax=Nematocida minor TaxID=1912983 RepID=UPI0022200DFA|nr:uncharacterized protein NEMIN01_2014 [Nematocida minor]KAI5192427.1 hypothetical protein NEMIN01_2014 [Nematocida minor]